MNLIDQKVFRIRENKKKVHFILYNTNLTEEFIIMAATLATRPAYHTFGHALGATEQAIRIAQKEGRSPQDIDLLASTMLVHDAAHQGVVRLTDEMDAFEITAKVVTKDNIEFIDMSFDAVMSKMRDLIIDTTFGRRAQIKDPLALIVQDADLAHLGLGIEYWLWASMGLVEEFNHSRKKKLTPLTFIREEQEKFVMFLSKISGTGKVYLSEGANALLNDPLEDVKILKDLPESVIEFAYKVRRRDITVKEFTDEMNKLLKEAKELV